MIVKYNGRWRVVNPYCQGRYRKPAFIEERRKAKELLESGTLRIEKDEPWHCLYVKGKFVGLWGKGDCNEGRAMLQTVVRTMEAVND